MTVAGVALSSLDKLLNIVPQEHQNKAAKVNNKTSNSTVQSLHLQKAEKFGLYKSLSDVIEGYCHSTKESLWLKSCICSNF